MYSCNDIQSIIIFVLASLVLILEQVWKKKKTEAVSWTIGQNPQT